MGRNNDTFTLVIDRNREEWSKFRRALRKEDQTLFDEMWRAPKLHLAACAFLADEVPFEAILISMLLEQFRKIKKLEASQYGSAEYAEILPPCEAASCSEIKTS